MAIPIEIRNRLLDMLQSFPFAEKVNMCESTRILYNKKTYKLRLSQRSDEGGNVIMTIEIYER